MKQQANKVDIRIKDFMDKKMAEFPELNQKNSSEVIDTQRGYFFETLLTLFGKKVF